MSFYHLRTLPEFMKLFLLNLCSSKWLHNEKVSRDKESLNNGWYKKIRHCLCTDRSHGTTDSGGITRIQNHTTLHHTTLHVKKTHTILPNNIPQRKTMSADGPVILFRSSKWHHYSYVWKHCTHVFILWPLKKPTNELSNKWIKPDSFSFRSLSAVKDKWQWSA